MRSQYPTAVYMTFFPNDEIRKIFSRLRRHTVYPIPRTKTNKYLPFIHYVLSINDLSFSGR